MGSSRGLSLMKVFKKASLIEKTFCVVAIAAAVMVIANYTKPQQEGFEKNREFVMKTGPEIFDDFYVSVYDLRQLLNNYMRM